MLEVLLESNRNEANKTTFCGTADFLFLLFFLICVQTCYHSCLFRHSLTRVLQPEMWYQKVLTILHEQYFKKIQEKKGKSTTTWYVGCPIENSKKIIISVISTLFMNEIEGYMKGAPFTMLILPC